MTHFERGVASHLTPSWREQSRSVLAFNYERVANTDLVLTLGFICWELWVRRGAHTLTIREEPEEALAPALGNAYAACEQGASLRPNSYYNS